MMDISTCFQRHNVRLSHHPLSPINVFISQGMNVATNKPYGLILWNSNTMEEELRVEQMHMHR